MILTSTQIDKRVVRMIRQKYPIDTEQKLSRILHGAAMGTYQPSAEEMTQVQAYQNHVVACRDWGVQFAITNDLERRTLEYTNATNRLKKYKREDGREEVIVAPVLDEFENVIEEGYVIKGIEPITPLMIAQNVYDDEGEITGTEEVVKSIIQKDRDEREAAQQIVDNVQADVLENIT